MNKISLNMKIIGVLLILFATYASTVKVADLDSTMESVERKIEIFEQHRILITTGALNNQLIRILQKIELSEANIATYLGQDISRIKELRQKALNRSIGITRQWNSLLSKGGGSEVYQEAEKRMNESFSNDKISVEEKITRIDEVAEEAHNNFSDRLKQKHENRDSYKAQLDSLNKDRSTWNSLFVWCQIVGLCLIALSEIFEMRKKH